MTFAATLTMPLVKHLLISGSFVLALASMAGCDAAPRADEESPVPLPSVTTLELRDTTVAADFVAAGVAEPLQHATLGTKLMGTVVSVLVREGDAVAAGQPLVRIDARDLVARQTQVAASIADAEAVHREASTQAARMRALYADSAATRAQLDAAETALARAAAAVHTAGAAAAELEAVTTYAVVRAPFAGTVVGRHVDPGAFASPGMPLVSVDDRSRVRISVSAPPDVVRQLRRGATLDATVEGVPVRAVVEGVVPAAAGNVYTVNALVANPRGTLMTGSAATLRLPIGERRALFLPTRALVREGDLTGVTLLVEGTPRLRWIRLGATTGALVEVTAGLRAGDRVVIPAGTHDGAERS